MGQGWIRLHRKLMRSPTFVNEKLLKVFIYCLLKATHCDYEQVIGRQKIPLEPGQFVYGRKVAAEELAMSESTVRDYIEILRKERTIDIKSTNKYSVITVVNWASYQLEEEFSDSKSDNKKTANHPTNGQQKDTYKNNKNINNKKNNINNSPSDGEDVEKNKTAEAVESLTTENQTFVDESDSAKSEPHQPGFSLPSVDSMAEEPQIEQPDKEKIPYQQIADLWNRVCLSFPKVEKLSKGRKDKVRVRWLELKSLVEFERIFRIMEQSSFLKGDNNNGWKATFDWIMVNDTNYTKVLEGQYANKRGPSKPPPTQPFGKADKFKDFVL